MKNVKRFGFGGAALLPVLAKAQTTPSTTVTQITEKVTEAMTQGETIAGAIVLGLFAIFAIKLLWRAK